MKGEWEVTAAASKVEKNPEACGEHTDIRNNNIN